MTIILNIYAPMFFHIKQNWQLENGAPNFFQALKLGRECLTKDEFEVFKSVLDRNKYFAHPEFILYSALFDQNILEKYCN